MCLHPKLLIKDGKYKETTFKGAKGEPYAIKTFTKCGVCPECVAEKGNSWVVRNYYEARACKGKACFITLTYRKNPYFLVKKDLQDFMKRLRITLIRQYNYYTKLRIFYCGEYGGLNGRPHYHVIIYNWKDNQRKYMGINKKGNLLFKSEIIQKCWGLGRTSYQEFNENEVPYIALYETTNETIKKAYIVKKETAKALENILKEKEKKGIYEASRINQIKQLQDLTWQAERNKLKYIAVKEFNGWSQALGWEQFKKEWEPLKENYSWEEPVGNKLFNTPKGWLIKCCNMKDPRALQEYKRRQEFEILQGETAAKREAEHKRNYAAKQIQKIEEWTETKQKIEDI